VSLPISGNERKECFNVDGQYGVSEFSAIRRRGGCPLPRTGIEVEAGYNLVFGDRGDPGALFTLVQPVVRYSRLDNGFAAPSGFVAPSVTWDWTKIDVGARVTILQNIDVTVEYAYHDIEASQQIDHDEFLATLRFRFPDRYQSSADIDPRRGDRASRSRAER
jgi:hypothetical protein